MDIDKYQAEQNKFKTILNRHFDLIPTIRDNYRNRSAKAGSFKKCISACERQILISPDTIEAWIGEHKLRYDFLKSIRSIKEVYSKPNLPSHTGYGQLVTIREKQGNYEEGIALCRAAMSQGWSGEWQEKIDALAAKSVQRKRKCRYCGVGYSYDDGPSVIGHECAVDITIDGKITLGKTQEEKRADAEAWVKKKGYSSLSAPKLRTKSKSKQSGGCLIMALLILGISLFLRLG